MATGAHASVARSRPIPRPQPLSDALVLPATELPFDEGPDWQRYLAFIRERWAALYAYYFQDARRERRFLALVAFVITFVAVRGIVIAIRAGVGPFGNVQVGELHIHHLVPGILLLLIVGFCWLLDIGTAGHGPGGFSALTAVLYGVAAALTLDEFALWLFLDDVYWESAGRVSVDVVVGFASLLVLANWGGQFIVDAVRDTCWLIAHALIALLGRQPRQRVS